MTSTTSAAFHVLAKAFFNHIDRPMRVMADLLRQVRFADEAMQLLTVEARC